MCFFVIYLLIMKEMKPMVNNNTKIRDVFNSTHTPCFVGNSVGEKSYFFRS